MHGQGTYTFNDGEQYIGEFKNDVKDGYGKTTFPNGHNYQGQYKNHKRHGKGIYTYKDKKRDVGEYKNNKLNGYAIRYRIDGSVLKEGIWKDDKFLYNQKKPTSTLNLKIEQYKSFCSEIGFIPGTEKFGECVVEAMKKG